MRIDDYFRAIEETEAKTQVLSEKISELRKQLNSLRLELDLDEANKLKAMCDEAYPIKRGGRGGDNDKDRRELFVFLFIITYSIITNDRIPHSIRYILTLFCKGIHGTSISRDWRHAKERYNEDKEFNEKANSIYEKFMQR